MRIIESKKLLTDIQFTFDDSELTLTMEEREEIINDHKGIRYLFSDKSDFEYKLFINFLLNECLKNNKSIYLFFSDRFIERKGRIRSYQKLFYKEKDLIGDKKQEEIEIDLDNNNSILVSIAKVEEDNLDFLVTRLFSSDFTFMFDSSKKEEDILSKDFLRSLKKTSLIINSMRYFNPLKTVLEYKKHVNFVMNLQSFGNNDRSVEMIIKNSEREQFLKIGKDYHLRNELISSN